MSFHRLDAVIKLVGSTKPIKTAGQPFICATNPVW